MGNCWLTIKFYTEYQVQFLLYFYFSAQAEAAILLTNSEDGGGAPISKKTAREFEEKNEMFVCYVHTRCFLNSKAFLRNSILYFITAIY